MVGYYGQRIIILTKEVTAFPLSKVC